MPCLLVLLILAFPRLVLLVMYFTSTYLQRAYHDLIIPLLGFLFLPLTTLAYAWLMNTHRPLEGTNLIYLLVAVIIDLGGWGGGIPSPAAPVIAYHTNDDLPSLVHARPHGDTYTGVPDAGMQGEEGIRRETGRNTTVIRQNARRRRGVPLHAH